MPFLSKAQQRKCYALKRRGLGKGWNCEEFSQHTDFTKLPERVAQTTEKTAVRSVGGSTAAPIKPLKPLSGLFQPTPAANSPQAGNRPAGTRPDGQPAVRTPQQRAAPPAQASLGAGPLTNGTYGAYGMRTPWINGLPAPPTVANGGVKTAGIAQSVGKLLGGTNFLQNTTKSMSAIGTKAAPMAAQLGKTLATKTPQVAYRAGMTLKPVINAVAEPARPGIGGAVATGGILAAGFAGDTWLRIKAMRERQQRLAAQSQPVHQ